MRVRSGIIAISVTMLVVAVAYPACTPDPGPKHPTVCIDRSASPMTYDPPTVHVDGGQKVKFKFTDGGGKIKITFANPSLFSSNTASGPDAEATAKSTTTQEQTDYTATDEETGKKADPIVIIDPSSLLQKQHKRLKKN